MTNRPNHPVVMSDRISYKFLSNCYDVDIILSAQAKTPSSKRRKCAGGNRNSAQTEASLLYELNAHLSEEHGGEFGTDHSEDNVVVDFEGTARRIA